jgi:hypothetical protein
LVLKHVMLTEASPLVSVVTQGAERACPEMTPTLWSAQHSNEPHHGIVSLNSTDH